MPTTLSGQILFNRLDHRDGLPQINVVSIYQDETGAMWFGTISGLCRYNGSSTRVFRSSPEYPGLTKNSILSITGNRNGAVYIRTEFDLIRYDIATEQFRVISSGVTGMFYGNGELWFIVDNSVYTWSEESGLISFRAEVEKNEGSLTPLYVSDTGDVWAGGRGGLSVVRNSTGERKGVNILDGVYVYSLCVDSEGLVWVGTRNDGLYALDAGGRVRHHFRQAPDADSISDNFVRTIAEDELGVIWVGTSLGLDSFDKHTGRWTNYSPDETQPGSLSDYSVFAIYRDMQNTIWVGTYYGGVNYFNPRRDIFTYYGASQTKQDRLSYPFIGKMVQDTGDNLWICTDGGGLNRLDLQTRKFTRYFYEEYNPNNMPGYHIKSICLDPGTDKLYMGVYGVGLWVLDTKTGKSVLRDRSDWAVLNMQLWRGSIIAQTGSAVYRIDTESDTLVPFSGDARLNELVNEESAYCFYIDRSDRMWMSTSSGLKCIDLETKERKDYVHDANDPRSFGKSAATSFVETTGGELFFGTLGSGLFRYRPATDDFDNYTEKNVSQVSDFSYHISPMADGNILILHNDSFSIFDPRPGSTVYRSTDNFPISGFFDGNSSHITPEGEIFIGGVNGLASVDQALLADYSSMEYVLYFDNMAVGGEDVGPGDATGILSKILPLTDRIRLRHDQNNLSIEFATSDYSLHMDESGYEYRMEGVDTEWITASSHTITYTNLDPGRYTLTVRETNSGKSEGSIKSRSLDIVVRPPFYMSVLAQIVYALLSVAFVVGIIFFFVWRYRMRTSLEMERREKENMEKLNKMKLGFFTNVSHEFRTPLTLIMAQIEHIMSAGDLSAPLRRRIAKVYDNATHMRDLISELLDFRKAEQGFHHMKIERVDLAEYIGGICRSFTEYAAKHRIRYEYDHPQEEAVEAYIDKAQLKKAIYNLLSNAFKFTSDGGEITVRLRVDDRVHILVEDNGIGISQEALSRIFERFYQVEYRTSGFSLGTGIGLALTKEIIESHHGEISVRSTLSKGSVFEVTLQKGSSHFTAGELIREPVATRPESTDGGPVAITVIPGEAASILIVEDNEQLRSLLSEIFSGEYTVYTAADGRQGLEMAAEHLPDIVLTDVMMPEMSGKEMCAAIKNDAKLSHIPVVMLSSFDSVDETVEGYMFGADDYVPKPFNSEILRARCGAIVRGRRQLYHTVAESRESTAVEIRSEQDRLFMEKVTNIIRDNFDNPDFNMDMLAAEMCMGRTNFYSKIREISGMTPNEFTLATRLRESTELLRNHLHLNISDIADMLGFYSSKYFSKCFKTFYGVTPAQWRKDHE